MAVSTMAGGSIEAVKRSIWYSILKCLHQDTPESPPNPGQFRESSDQFLNTNCCLDQLTNNQTIYHLQSLFVGAAYRTRALI